MILLFCLLLLVLDRTGHHFSDAAIPWFTAAAMAMDFIFVAGFISLRREWIRLHALDSIRPKDPQAN